MTKLELVKAVIAKTRLDFEEYDGFVNNADEWEIWDDDRECYVGTGRHDPESKDKVVLNENGVIVWHLGWGDGSFDRDFYVNGLSTEEFRLLKEWNNKFVWSMHRLDEKVRGVKWHRLNAFVVSELSGVEYLKKNGLCPVNWPPGVLD